MEPAIASRKTPSHIKQMMFESSYALNIPFSKIGGQTSDPYNMFNINKSSSISQLSMQNKTGMQMNKSFATISNPA